MALPGHHTNYDGIYDSDDAAWLKTGHEPPRFTVWSDGHDVTDQPVSTWPKYFQRYYAEGWRPMSGPNAEPPSAPGRRTSGMRAKY